MADLPAAGHSRRDVEPPGSAYRQGPHRRRGHRPASRAIARGAAHVHPHRHHARSGTEVRPRTGWADPHRCPGHTQRRDCLPRLPSPRSAPGAGLLGSRCSPVAHPRDSRGQSGHGLARQRHDHAAGCPPLRGRALQPLRRACRSSVRFLPGSAPDGAAVRRTPAGDPFPGDEPTPAWAVRQAGSTAGASHLGHRLRAGARAGRRPRLRSSHRARLLSADHRSRLDRRGLSPRQTARTVRLRRDRAVGLHGCHPDRRRARIRRLPARHAGWSDRGRIASHCRWHRGRGIAGLAGPAANPKERGAPSTLRRHHHHDHQRHPQGPTGRRNQDPP